jgi:hypothetical protein
MIALDVLSARNAVAFEALAPVLRDVVGRPPEYEKARSNPRRHRIASVTDWHNDIARVRDLLDLLQPWESELRDAQARTREADDARRLSDEALDEAQARQRQLDEQVTQLQTDLESARQELRGLRDQTRDAHIVASSDVAELRARTLAFINTRVRDLVATAKEASEVEPPRAETTARLLAQALDEIQREAEWLRSSA